MSLCKECHYLRALTVVASFKEDLSSEDWEHYQKLKEALQDLTQVFKQNKNQSDNYSQRLFKQQPDRSADSKEWAPKSRPRCTLL